MDAQRAKAFDFAKESTNLLITLSTGFIGITITFADDLLGVANRDAIPTSLLVSWIAFFLCAFFGAWVHFALTGELEPIPEPAPPAASSGKPADATGGAPQPPRIPSIRRTNVTLPATLQVFAFLLGLGAALWFGVFVRA